MTNEKRRQGRVGEKETCESWICGQIQVGIDGAEKFKLNMKDANYQALDCALTLDLMKPTV